MSLNDDEQGLAKPEENDASEESAEVEDPQFSGIMRRAMSMMASVSNPILDKLESRHIDRVLDLSDAHADRMRSSEREGRIFFLGGALIGVIFLGFIIVMLQTNPDLLLQLVLPIITFLAGLGAGWGIGKSH